MKVVAKIDDVDAHKEFRRFFKNTGKTIWEAKISKIESLPVLGYPSPNFYRNHLAARNPLTTGIAEYLKLDMQGKMLRKHATDQLMKICWYLKVCNALFYAHPELSQHLRAILIDDSAVRSFLFELDIATHFFRLGLDVRFTDLEGREQFDLLISDGQSELEVECKTKSADAGRRVTREKFDLLCDVLGASWSAKESVAVLLTCKGQLNGSQAFFQKLAATIQRSRSDQEDRGQCEGVAFELKILSPNTAIRTIAEAATALAPYWNADSGARYSIISGSQTLIIGCQSTDEGRALASIYSSLRHGASQLSRRRPAILACQIEDIDDQDWDKFRIKAGGLSRMKDKLFSDPPRPHINYVVFSSTKTPPKRVENVTSFSATYLSFVNEDAVHEFPKSFLAVTS